jgi:hypothetical protein
MKRLWIATFTLVLASMACATFESFLGGNDDNGNDLEPTNIPVLQPTTPLDTLTPTSTSFVMAPTSEATLTPTKQDPTGTPTLSLTPAEGGDPSTTNFFTCVGPCMVDGSNDQSSFAERTEIVYFQFEYENFPVGASYTRWWTRNGVEWARYQCAWPGPQSGLDQITLTEPNGLASGTWQVTITIDGVIVLQETLVVQGTWSYWDPAGFFGACYGKR